MCARHNHWRGDGVFSGGLKVLKALKDAFGGFDALKNVKGCGVSNWRGGGTRCVD